MGSLRRTTGYELPQRDGLPRHSVSAGLQTVLSAIRTTACAALPRHGDYLSRTRLRAGGASWPRAPAAYDARPSLDVQLNQRRTAGDRSELAVMIMLPTRATYSRGWTFYIEFLLPNSSRTLTKGSTGSPS